MTPDEFDKMVDKAIETAKRYQEKLTEMVESGELKGSNIAPEELKTWPLFEMSIEPVHPMIYRGIRLQPIFSPMEYSHDDKDKRTE